MKKSSGSYAKRSMRLPLTAVAFVEMLDRQVKST